MQDFPLFSLFLGLHISDVYLLFFVQFVLGLEEDVDVAEDGCLAFAGTSFFGAFEGFNRHLELALMLDLPLQQILILLLQLVHHILRERHIHQLLKFQKVLLLTLRKVSLRGHLVRVSYELI